jgi:hypothetical protein
MQFLDLDANKLTGTIPTWIGLLTSLDHLLLNRNELTGTLPTTLSNMRHLTVFLIDGNSLTGNADVVCQSPDVNPQFFVSDCYPSPDGTGPEVQCLCCALCCDDGDPSFNDRSWTSNIDPAWEYGYVRPSYEFNIENAPSIISKNQDQDNDEVITDLIP